MTDKDSYSSSLIEDSIHLVGFLMEKQYALSNIGLTDKAAFDWTRAGLYLEERKKKGRRKYNAIEYVWLRLVKDLRDFGLSFDAIRNIRTFLLGKIEMKQSLVEFIRDDFENDDLKSIQDYLDGAINSEKDWKEIFESTQSNLVNTVLCSIIHQAVIFKSNIHLLIKKDGSTMVTDGEPFDKHVSLGDVLSGPYISYPLRHILSEFIAREDLQHFELMDDFIELSDQEEKVLSLLREGGITSLTVRLKDGEIRLIETEEDVDIKEVKGKLVDLIKRNSYQEISYKTENGKIVSLKRKTKHKG